MKLPNKDDIASKALFRDYDVQVCISSISEEIHDLLPGEYECIKHSVPKRQQEFATGRRLSRYLLGQQHHENYCLLNDQDRVPIWPDNVYGSIAHSDNLCIVAISPKHNLLHGIGVDVEPDQALEKDIWPAILRSEEALQINQLAVEQQAFAVNRYFCAKEAAYKSVFPITRKIISFQDVHIDFSNEQSDFVAEFHEPETKEKLSNLKVEGSLYSYSKHIFSSSILK